MPYGRKYRRSFRRRVRRSRTGSRPFRGRSFRTRATSRRFRRPVTGIGAKKTLKVRKEFTWNIHAEAPGAGVSYNQLMVGCVQSANLNGWVKYQGTSTTGVGSATIDPNGSTGLRQWFSFYERYVVHASKIKVELVTPNSEVDQSYGLAVTLVPTVGFHLANTPGGGGTPFDSSNIDPAELPYAKKILLPTSGYPNNAMTRKLSNYVSVKKMLNIKDIQDVAVGTPGAPFVPAITIPTLAADITQPQATFSQLRGIYWNLVFQEIGKNQDPAPAQPFHGGVSVRIIQTSYIQYSDRLPLTTN